MNLKPHSKTLGSYVKLNSKHFLSHEIVVQWQVESEDDVCDDESVQLTPPPASPVPRIQVRQRVQQLMGRRAREKSKEKLIIQFDFFIYWLLWSIVSERVMPASTWSLGVIKDWSYDRENWLTGKHMRNLWQLLQLLITFWRLSCGWEVECATLSSNCEQSRVLIHIGQLSALSSVSTDQLDWQ